MSLTKQRETEAFLGPLGAAWERGVTLMGRYYFVNHEEKRTTWVDPRTEDKRTHDITKIQEGELPYAWEEAYDEACGLYYIDHNTKSTFLDPPWDKVIQEHYKDLKEHVEKESKRLESKELESKRREKIEQATDKVQQLEGARERLEREVKEMKAKARQRESAAEEATQEMVEVAPAMVDAPVGVQAHAKAALEIEEQLQEVAMQLPGAAVAAVADVMVDAPLIDLGTETGPASSKGSVVEEEEAAAEADVEKDLLVDEPIVEAPMAEAVMVAEPVMDAPAAEPDVVEVEETPEPVPLAAVKSTADTSGPIKMAPTPEMDAQMASEMKDFQARLQELKLLIDAMTDETRNYANMTTAAEKEVQEIGYLLNEEASQRAELSAFVEGIKSDMVTMVKEASGSQEGLDAESVASLTPEDAGPLAMSSAAQPAYLVEMEAELLDLKARLEAREAAASSEESLADGGSMEGMDAAEVVRQRMIKESEDMAMPDWLKKVNMDLGKSKTLRSKVNKMQQQNPDAMSFREKMLFYTAGALERDSRKGKGPQN